MATTLFEFIDSLFDDRAYSNVSEQDKKNYFFNLNRFLSNKFPTEINAVNNVIGLNRDHIPYIVDSWQKYLKTKFVRKPNFFFWKTAVGSSEKDLLDKFDKEVINGYCRTHMIDSGELNSLLSIFPEQLEIELKTYQSTMNFSSRKKPKK